MTEQTVTQTKEVRFAVVMYGGVSLAIYINGVAQELYNLVRASATRAGANSARTYLFKDEELNGAGRIYRKLGEMLDARFVVDILSGTSAGGINAVFLAKSLANGETFEQLRDLWIQEGDIGVLINDRESGLDREGLKFSGEPASLLNSQRMYFKLLYALDTMNPDRPAEGGHAAGRSPYVDELDLFVTATDIRGLVQKTNLLGGTADEYRYKNVFRFHYATAEAAGGEDVNDFKPANNPFLAFAARCTSAFPFAFEPMRLGDVKAVVATPAFRKNYTYDPALWKAFYKDYLQEGDSSTGGGEGFETRSFGDGGYLDNKPFSYVTETLLRRRADLPVDRKLIYIEPAPEHPVDKDVDVRPDALQNVAAALLALPRYETIREDLQVILERNKMIERVGTIMAHIRHASRASLNKNVNAWQRGGAEWAKKYLDEQVLGWYGPGYAAYHQLRVASLLDDLGSAFVRAMSLEENSEAARSFRQETLEGWRKAYYRIDPQAKDKRKSENDLLFRLDISWRIRRLQFMQNLIDDLLNGLSEPAPGMDQAAHRETQTRAREIVRDSKGKESDWPFEEDAEARSAYRQMLLWVKARFNEAYKDLRASGRLLRSRGILADIEKGGERGAGDENLLAYGEQLRALKEALESQAADESVYARLEDLSTALASAEARPKVRGAVRAMLSANARLCKQILGLEPAPPELPDPFSEEAARPSTLKTALSRARASLGYYYDRFEYYDMLTFPLFFGTEVGESDVVEIIRVSPEDAPSLRPGSQKLAGTKLGNFGAFFVRGWRENDILWGRLDGAECLINALLPGEEHAADRAILTREAHQAILEETFLGADQKQLFESLQSGELGDPDGVKAALSRALGGQSGLLERFRRDYTVDLNFPPETTLKVSARASRVTGKMLAELSSKYPAALSSPAGMVARLGQVFNGLVQLALPQSLPNLIFNSLVWLLYPIELLLALGGRVFGLPDVSILGAIALGVTIAAHLGVLYLQAILKRNLPALRLVHGLIKILAVLLVAALVALVYLGLVYLGVLDLPQGALGTWLRGLQGR